MAHIPLECLCLKQTLITQNPAMAIGIITTNKITAIAQSE